MYTPSIVYMPEKPDVRKLTGMGVRGYFDGWIGTLFFPKAPPPPPRPSNPFNGKVLHEVIDYLVGNCQGSDVLSYEGDHREDYSRFIGLLAESETRTAEEVNGLRRRVASGRPSIIHPFQRREYIQNEEIPVLKEGSCYFCPSPPLTLPPPLQKLRLVQVVKEEAGADMFGFGGRMEKIPYFFDVEICPTCERVYQFQRTRQSI